MRVNKREFEKKIMRKETRAHEAKRQEELNQDRVDHGKEPFSPEQFEKEEMKEIIVIWTNISKKVSKGIRHVILPNTFCRQSEKELCKEPFKQSMLLLFLGQPSLFFCIYKYRSF